MCMFRLHTRRKAEFQDIFLFLFVSSSAVLNRCEVAAGLYNCDGSPKGCGGVKSV